MVAYVVMNDGMVPNQSCSEELATSKLYMQAATGGLLAGRVREMVCPVPDSSRLL
jgi:hypothetical protein